VYNIQKAVSRLDYAPKLKEVEITDIKKGLGVFTPKPGQPVSFAALKSALKKAGYTLDAADITVAGSLAHDDTGWWLVSDPGGQHFALEGADLERVLAEAAAGSRVEVTGDWKTVGEKADAREVIIPREVKRAGGEPAEGRVGAAYEVSAGEAPAFRIERANYFMPPSVAPATAEPVAAPKPLAPIRVTSPGLTVYKGGAVTPRLYLIKQHLGDLEVHRQMLDVSVSYTPTPRLQLEAEVPFSRTSFDDGRVSGSGMGLGNVVLWGKYRFFRKVKTYGDRQAAARFGLELPTGKTDAPGVREVDASAFVRQQLTPISGGLSPHFDLAFSQAGGRFIFGGNAEAVLRSERDGFRVGHEVRVSTDTEYVLLPREHPGQTAFPVAKPHDRYSFVSR
jgi:ketosteroid isomerase-like protein